MIFLPLHFPISHWCSGQWVLFPQAKAFTKHSLLWAFNYLTEIYPNPCLLISFKIIEESEMTWREAFKATDAQGTHSSPPPTPVPKPNLLALSSVPGSPPFSFFLLPTGSPCDPSSWAALSPPSHCRHSFHIILSSLLHSLHLASFPLRKLLWQGTGVCQGDAGREGLVLSFLSEEPSVTR